MTPHVSLSRRLVFAAVVLTVIITCTEGEYQPFNCIRKNTLCLGSGSTCNLDGSCSCPSTREGHDCGLLKADVRMDGCSGRECLNGGTCYTDAVKKLDTCYCPPAFYGERCSIRRVNIVCTSSSMIVNINPYVDPSEGFVGNIYVLPLINNAKCHFKPAISLGIQGYEMELPLKGGDCEEGIKETTNTDGTVTYRYIVVSRFETGISTYLDEGHVLTCTLRADGVVRSFVGSGFDEVDPQYNSGVNTNRGYQPVSLHIKHRGTHEVVSTPVRVGEALYLEFKLPETDILFGDYRVESCTGQALDPVNNTIVTQETPLISGNCIDSKGESVMDGEFTKTDRITKLDFRAFKFFYTSIVHFICTLKLCPANNTDACKPLSCPANLTSGRRKRETTTLFVRSDVIGQRLQVYDIYAQTNTNDCPVVEVDCDMLYFYLVLAILAFFAILSFLCAIYLCFKMAHRRRRYDTIVIRKRTLPDGNVVRSVEEVHPANYSTSSDRGPIINSIS